MFNGNKKPRPVGGLSNYQTQHPVPVWVVMKSILAPIQYMDL